MVVMLVILSLLLDANETGLMCESKIMSLILSPAVLTENPVIDSWKSIRHVVHIISMATFISRLTLIFDFQSMKNSWLLFPGSRSHW